MNHEPAIARVKQNLECRFLVPLRRKECQYLTILVFNKLHFPQSTKLFVTGQKLSGFDTLVQIKKKEHHSFSKACIAGIFVVSPQVFLVHCF